MRAHTNANNEIGTIPKNSLEKWRLQNLEKTFESHFQDFNSWIDFEKFLVNLRILSTRYKIRNPYAHFDELKTVRGTACVHGSWALKTCPWEI
jgi:hypothetical protein